MQSTGREGNTPAAALQATLGGERGMGERAAGEGMGRWMGRGGHGDRRKGGKGGNRWGEGVGGEGR